MNTFGYAYVGTATKVMATGNFWFTLVIGVTLLLLPVVVERFYYIDTRPTLTDKLQMKQKLLRAAKMKDQVDHFTRAPSIRRSMQSFRRSGYAFAHTEGFGKLITSGTNMNAKQKQGKVGSNAQLAKGAGGGGGRKSANNSEERLSKNVNSSNNMPSNTSQLFKIQEESTNKNKTDKRQPANTDSKSHDIGNINTAYEFDSEMGDKGKEKAFAKIEKKRDTKLEGDGEMSTLDDTTHL